MKTGGKEQSQAVYDLLGLRLVSNYPFSNCLKSELLPPGPGDETPSLIFHLSNHPPFSMDSQRGELAFSSPSLPGGGQSAFTLHRFDACDLASFAGIADFYIRPSRIDCHLLNPAHLTIAEEILLGILLAYWLEIHGVPVIHAAAVVATNGAVAFPSHSGSGKSTLAAAFLQAGFRLLSDDMLPVDETASGFEGRPGLPQINLWPIQQVYFTGLSDPLNAPPNFQKKKHVPIEKINFASFCSDSQRLACFYLPCRSVFTAGKQDIEIIPLKPSEAVIELVRYSSVPNIVESFGLQPRRLAFFARLVQQVPVRRLVYPSGFEFLPRVVEAVLQDLEKLSTRRQDLVYAA